MPAPTGKHGRRSLRIEGSARQWCLKYCTARSCFSAAVRLPNVPRFFHLPVRGSALRE